MIFIVFWVVWIVMCYMIADKNMRDKNWAILMGLLFGLIAVVVYALIGKKHVT